MPDMASYHADLNDTIEKRQQKFIRKVGNPYMMRVGTVSYTHLDVYKRQTNTCSVEVYQNVASEGYQIKRVGSGNTISVSSGKYYIRRCV